jgi:glycosyltransferase involved in cell wall biosynthesis
VRVLLSTFQCGPGLGSEPGNGWYWATGLAAHGHDVTVLTQISWRDVILEQKRTDIDFHFFDYPGQPTTTVHGIRVYDVYRRWQDAAVEYAQGLDKQFDVVHHAVWGSLHFGSKLWRLPVPLVYGPIGGGQITPTNYRSYYGSSWPMEWVRNISTGQLLRFNGRTRETMMHAATVLATNSATEAAARRLGATDVRYFLAEGLPENWIVEPRERPAGVPVVLWVGRMLPRKAPTLTVEAFAELRRSMRARLVMIGDGPMLNEVRATAARLGVADDVGLLGRLPWSQVKEHYDSASVFVFNSLRDSSGAQFLEALGRGLPAVTLDLHGIGDLKVGLAAEKVELPHRPAELPARMADALRKILTGDDWEARSTAGTAFAAEHVWSAKVAAMSEIYREVATR